MEKEKILEVKDIREANLANLEQEEQFVLLNSFLEGIRWLEERTPRNVVLGHAYDVREALIEELGKLTVDNVSMLFVDFIDSANEKEGHEILDAAYYRYLNIYNDEM